MNEEVLSVNAMPNTTETSGGQYQIRNLILLPKSKAFKPFFTGNKVLKPAFFANCSFARPEANWFCFEPSLLGAEGLHLSGQQPHLPLTLWA